MNRRIFFRGNRFHLNANLKLTRDCILISSDQSWEHMVILFTLQQRGLHFCNIVNDSTNLTIVL